MVTCSLPDLAVSIGVIAEIDIWRAAHLMVQQHKDGAVDAARQRAAEIEKADDAQRHAVWLRIAAAVAELQRAPAESELPN